MPLSRKKEDKVGGTGRLHIMKNRYGMDGHTFSVTANTATGHFEVFPYNTDLSGDEESFAPKTRSNSYDDVDAHTKRKAAAAYDQVKQDIFSFEKK